MTTSKLQFNKLLQIALKIKKDHFARFRLHRIQWGPLQEENSLEKLLEA